MQQSWDGETEAAQLDPSTEPATPVEPAGSLAKEDDVRISSVSFQSVTTPALLSPIIRSLRMEC